MSLKIAGFDSLMKEFDMAPAQLSVRLEQSARKESEALASAARAGAPVAEGRLRNSIQAFVEKSGSDITGGAGTSYPVAWYHEFGTGPVGEANNHPAAGELGITHRADGWTYWSDDVAEARGPGQDGEPNGFVYTEGVPARAFMYNAMKAREDAITSALGAAVREVFR